MPLSRQLPAPSAPQPISRVKRCGLNLTVSRRHSRPPATGEPGAPGDPPLNRGGRGRCGSGAECDSPLVFVPLRTAGSAGNRIRGAPLTSHRYLCELAERKGELRERRGGGGGE